MRTKKFKEALEAVKVGDKARGQKLLVNVLKTDPKDEEAWLMLAKVVDDKKQRQDCLEQVIKINPKNETARLGLAQLNKKSKRVAATRTKARSNRLFAVIGVLLLLGSVIVMGAFWLIREKNTEVVAVDLGSVLAWGMVDEDMLIDIGNEVKTDLENEKRELLARNPDRHNEYVYWRNVDISRVAGYLRVRLAAAMNEAELVEVQELRLLYEFSGPASIENPTIEHAYVIVKVRLPEQESEQLEIKSYAESAVPPIWDCYSCSAYTFEQCAALKACYWITDWQLSR